MKREIRILKPFTQNIDGGIFVEVKGGIGIKIDNATSIGIFFVMLGRRAPETRRRCSVWLKSIEVFFLFFSKRSRKHL